MSWDLCGKKIAYNGFPKADGLAQIDRLNPQKYQKKLNHRDFMKGDFNIVWFAVNEELKKQLKPHNKIRLVVQDTLGDKFYSQKHKYREFIDTVQLAVEENKK